MCPRVANCFNPIGEQRTISGLSKRVKQNPLCDFLSGFQVNTSIHAGLFRFCEHAFYNRPLVIGREGGGGPGELPNPDILCVCVSVSGPLYLCLCDCVCIYMSVSVFMYLSISRKKLHPRSTKGNCSNVKCPPPPPP